MVGGRVFADAKGRSPAWMMGFSTVVMNLVWVSYDALGKRAFGDGERTMEEGEGQEGVRGRRGSFASALRGKEEAVDEEKKGLLDGFDG
jgi:hypothetical protein